jgi:RNA polymerase sigma factor (sigma-70 family)
MKPRPDKDLELTLLVRNNQIKSRRLAMGMSQADLAEATGIPLQTVGGYESLRLSPTKMLRDYRCRAPMCSQHFSLRNSPLFCVTHSRASETDRASWEASYERPTVMVWRSSAQALATFFDVEPADLFPGSIKAIKKNRVVSTADVPELMAILGLASGEPEHAQIGDGMEVEQLNSAVATALKKLPAREQKVLRMRFFQNLTLDQTSEKLKVTRERTRQIEKRALRRLQHPANSKALREVR